MKIVIFTITSILLASICHAQKPQEVDVFKKELLSAWNQKDSHSLDTLFSKDSVNEDANKRYIEWCQKHRDSPGGDKINNLTRVSYYEAAALDFAGIRIKRHYKVGGGFNFIFEFIS